MGRCAVPFGRRALGAGPPHRRKGRMGQDNQGDRCLHRSVTCLYKKRAPPAVGKYTPQAWCGLLGARRATAPDRQDRMPPPGEVSLRSGVAGLYRARLSRGVGTNAHRLRHRVGGERRPSRRQGSGGQLSPSASSVDRGRKSDGMGANAVLPRRCAPAAAPAPRGGGGLPRRAPGPHRGGAPGRLGDDHGEPGAGARDGGGDGRGGSRAALAEAAACLEAALRVYDPVHLPYDHVRVTAALARVRGKLGRGGVSA